MRRVVAFISFIVSLGSAVWALYADGKTFISTVPAGNQVAFGAREDVDDESKNTRNEDQDHPDYGVIHVARFRVLVYPNKESDVKHDQGNDQHNAECSAGHAAQGG